MVWVFAIFIVVYVAPFICERRKPDMTNHVRRNAPGQFAKLSDGQTHYQWHGPSDGPVLVAVHGLTTPSYIWEALVPGLVKAGYRVLTYDLYGRGFSDRPSGVQTRHFFIRQLRDLLDHQGVTGQFTLMGYSMGGSIATVFASEEPDRIARMVLLAPSGMAHRPAQFDAFVAWTGRLGDWVMLGFGGWMARRSIADSVIASRQKAEANWRGYLPSVLSSMRNLLAERLQEEHKNLAAAQIPTVAVWGEADDVIPLTALGRLTEWNRSVTQVTLARAGHGLPITHADEVIAAILDNQM